MDDVVVGLFAVAVGALFCFSGFLAMRFLIPLWGAFTGFVFGAALVDGFTDEGFLGNAVGWAVGIAVGLLFGLVAYLYYEISVVIAMGAIGFSLGTSVMVALGVSWNWVIVLVGLAAGTLLALVAIISDLPTIVLVVLTALGGANAVVFGLMLIFGAVDTDEFDSAVTTKVLDDDWWWYATFVVLAVLGIVVQVSKTQRLSASLRDTWADAGGKQLRRG